MYFFSSLNSITMYFSRLIKYENKIEPELNGNWFGRPLAFLRSDFDILLHDVYFLSPRQNVVNNHVFRVIICIYRHCVQRLELLIIKHVFVFLLTFMWPFRQVFSQPLTL